MPTTSKADKNQTNQRGGTSEQHAKAGREGGKATQAKTASKKDKK